MTEFSHIAGNLRLRRCKWIRNRPWFEWFTCVSTIDLPKWEFRKFTGWIDGALSNQAFAGADWSYDNTQGPTKFLTR